jgi:L-fuculose-phosphate aldolase
MPQSPTFPSEQTARDDLARVARRVAAQGLIRSNDGNLSIRLGEDLFLASPSGYYKYTLQPADLIVINEHGEVLDGPPGARPTSEMRMHLEAYRQRPDIGAVLHAHPPYATALTLAGIPFPINIIPEVPIALGEVLLAEYATPGTQALAESIIKPIKRSNHILLSHHGSLNVGKTLDEAMIALERLEHTAYTYFIAHSLGKVIPLPPDEMERLMAIGQEFRGQA